MARFAAIDAGTNSTKMTIAEVDEEGVPMVLATDFEPTRLGLDMQEGIISAAAIERTAAALCRFVALAHQYEAAKVRAVATQFARVAKNFSTLQATVYERCGLELEVISGDEEARLAYRAIGLDFPHSEAARLVFNIGGGSTEVIYGHHQPEQMVSVPLGASSLARHFPEATERISEARLYEIINHVASTMRHYVNFLDKGRDAVLIGSGGTVTNMGAIDNIRRGGNPGKVHLYRLPINRLRRIIHTLSSLSQRERIRVPGLSPDRAGIIVSGALIALVLADLVGAGELVVAMRGLRDGMLAEMSEQ